MKITVITPSWNSEKYIRETIESVIYQRALLNKEVELQYIIVDNCSNDRTLEIISSYHSPHITLISEPDNGMYDAVAKGLNMAEGDIVSYINSDDYYPNYAFDIVVEIFGCFNAVKWITGAACVYNCRSHLTNYHLPFKYKRSMIMKGFYGRYLPFIQQESTFWRRDMLDGIDLEEFSKLRFAGDFYLWKHFAKKEELYIVSAYLGGFRFHSKNKSRDISKYIDEFKIISDRCPILDLDLIRIPLYHLAWWFLPGTLKNMLNRKIIWCNHSDGSWHLGNGLVNAILLYLRKTE